jgi:hypothetical protein
MIFGKDKGSTSLYRSWLRRILTQSEMRARLIVIHRIQSQDPPQMPFAKDQNVIQTVAMTVPVILPILVATARPYYAVRTNVSKNPGNS